MEEEDGDLAEYEKEQNELGSIDNNINDIQNPLQNTTSNNIPDRPKNKKTEEELLLLEISQFEKEKQLFYSQRKEQSNLLQKDMETLSQLLTVINQPQIKNNNIYQNNDNEIQSTQLIDLMTLNSKINEIESAERILEEERNYFEQYKKNSENLIDLKKVEIEKLKSNYDKEENELNKKYVELENKEKIVNEKLNEFENQKQNLTDRYNMAIKKEAELQNASLRIENSRRELNSKNIAINNERQMINNTIKLIQNEIIENNLEKNNIQQEKKNLKLRQETIDSLRMQYLGNNLDENLENDNHENNLNNYNNYLSPRLYNKERNYDNNKNNMENLQRLNANEYLLYDYKNNNFLHKNLDK